MPPDDLPKIGARADAWSADLKPEGEAQAWIVSRAAALTVRLDRCSERERIALVENTAAAERTWFKTRRAWARRLRNRLIEQPVRAFARLRTSALGIDWLIARWEELASDLEDEMGYWSQQERERAVRLLGLSLRDTADADPRFRPLWVHALALDESAPARSAFETFEASQAPNELQNGQDRDTNDDSL